MALRLGITNSFFNKETFAEAVDFFSAVFCEKTIEMFKRVMIRKEKNIFIVNNYLTNPKRRFWWRKFQIYIYLFLRALDKALKARCYSDHQ